MIKVVMLSGLTYDGGMKCRDRGGTLGRYHMGKKAG